MTNSEQNPTYSRKVSESHEADGTRKSVQNMIEKLSTIPEEDWRSILHKYGHKVEEHFDIKKVFRIGLKVNLITKDLGNLKSNLKIMNRNDLLQKLPEDLDTLSSVSDIDFRHIFKREALGEEKLEYWKNVLKKHIMTQNTKVEPILGHETKELDDIYIPLTVLEQEFYRKALEKTETNSELHLLAKYGDEKCEQQQYHESMQIMEQNNTLMCQFKRHELIEVICCRKIPEKFTQEKSLCITGNPGSGKTFLSTSIGLLYGKNLLDQFDFCLAIPCRHPEWHQLEQARENPENTIGEKLVISWLKLGMNSKLKWSEDLSEHLFNTDGDGLLLIIDSVDEFTKEVPFNQTILSSLLHRKILSKSTIILTSRPGVWSDITSENSDIKIESQFHVLGFSPKNRDRFFKNTLKDESKLKECYELFHYHYEIGLLSLIPVNASFFAHLFISDASKLSYTLTKLFSSLVLYLIRRQLSRMKLDRYIEIENLHQLDKDILKCLYEIGEVAYNGVSNRELSFTQVIPLNLGGKKFVNNDWLGLVNVQIKLDTFGKEIKEWSFSHLTMQEYVSAQWLSSIKWYEICLITRYIVSSTDMFSMFKMVLRFVCGLLGRDAKPTIYIAFKHYLIEPVKSQILSRFQQLCYQDTSQSGGILNKNDVFFKNSDLEAFTKQFLSMISLIVEADSDSLKRGIHPPKDSSLYICSKIEPSEWLNFTKSMKYLEGIHLLYVITDFLTFEELELFLKNLKDCELEYLVIKFIEKDYESIYPYIEILTQFDLSSTKVCFDLVKCDLSDSNPSSAMDNIWDKINIDSLRLLNNDISVLKNFTSHLNSLKNFYFSKENWETNTELESLLQNTKLRGLHLFEIPEGYFLSLSSAMPSLTCLEEVSLHTSKDFLILPELLSSCSKLTHLSIRSDFKSNQDHSEDLLQLIQKHEDSLKTLQLFSLDKIGHTNLNSIFDSLRSCYALVRLNLEDCDVTFDTDSPSDFKMPENLISLELINVSLTDPGLYVLIRMFPFHKTLRYIKIFDCKLTSNSCEPLRNLIYTLIRLKELEVSDELLKPDDKPFQNLQKAVESLSAILTFPAPVTSP